MRSSRRCKRSWSRSSGGASGNVVDRLRAQGYGWNHKRIWRVYCQLRLNLPRRTKRRVPQRERQPLWVEPRMNAVWSIDFMRDTLYSGRVLPDAERARRGQARGAGHRRSGQHPADPRQRVPGSMIDLHGRPGAIRCDNGPELTSQAFTDWCRGARHRDPLHSAGQAQSERVHRALQPDLPRGGPQRLPVRLARRGQRDHGRMARALQRNQATRCARKPAASALPRALIVAETPL